MKANIEFQVPVLKATPVNLSLLSTLTMEARCGDHSLRVHMLDTGASNQLFLEIDNRSSHPAKASRLLAALADYLFSRSGQLDRLDLSPDLLRHLHQKCRADGLVSEILANGHGRIERGAFYQNGLLWHWRGNSNTVTETWRTSEKGIRHPLRQPQPDGVIYQRYDFQADTLVTFESLDPDRHLELFHDWMNQPRVAEFWELDKSREELRDYIVQQRADSRSWPVLASFDGVPFGYLELYWVAEDRLAPYYDSGHWDRGCHLLVGNTQYLGSRYSRSWSLALSHFLFLDDPRTRTLSGEPRADNKRLLKLLEPGGWHFVKEFDFPHKRAALVQCQRADFFQKVRL